MKDCNTRKTQRLQQLSRGIIPFIVKSVSSRTNRLTRYELLSLISQALAISDNFTMNEEDLSCGINSFAPLQGEDCS
jgi:hypothetical protein